MRTRIFVMMVAIAIAGNASGASRHLVVPPGNLDLTGMLANHGLTVVEQYDRGVWVEGQAAALRSEGVFVKTYEDWDLIQTVKPFRIGQRDSSPEATEPGLYLIHFRAPVKSSWTAAIKSTPGVTVVQSFPNLAMIIHVAETPTTLNSLPGVDWAGQLKPEWRISPHVAAAAKQSNGSAVLMMVNTPGLERSLQGLADLGVSFQIPQTLTSPWFPLRAEGNRDMVEAVVGLEHVLWIEPNYEKRLHDERQGVAQAGEISNWLPNGPGYKAWLASVGLDDISNVIVDVADDGWDTGDLTPGNHHPDFDDALGNSRVIYQVNLCGDGDHGAGGHGTLNQSIVLGDGDGTGMADPDGYAYGTGIAPTARGGHSKIFSDGGSFCPSTMTEITTGAYSAGARITSNSWGAATYGGYNADSAEYDLLVRDANNNSADGLQEFTIVFSAGNDGPSATQTGSPGTAKNVITSGASENVRDHGVVDGCNDSNADSFQDLTDFTSPGPTEDGRIKPDAVGPGNHIQGAASQYSGYTGSSVCDQYWPTGQTSYAWSSGTSHSAPGMAGMAALIHEWYDQRAGAMPSPAMTKAIMLASGTDIVGGDDGNGGSVDFLPNARQGWGLLNMGRFTDGTPTYFFDQGHVFTSSGQDFTPIPMFTVVDPSQPVRIMVVYTDAPGNPNASPTGGLANDLDLEVTVGADVYLGNNFSSGFSVPGGSADATNNVEAVYFPAGAVNTFGLRVIASTVSGDAIPGDGNPSDQDFALFIYNATDQSSEGVVSLSSSTYSCSDSITITVSDEDLQGAGSQAVALYSDSEPTPISVLLTEDPVGSGFFSGSYQTTGVPANPSDDLLSVTNGDTITTEYDDADDGSGSPATATATALADCEAPLISDVQVTAITTDGATISWTTSEPADSSLDWHTLDPPGADSVGAGAMVTDHEIVLTGLNTCTTHFFTVSSMDPAGNGSTSSEHTFTTAQAYPLDIDSTDTPLSIPDNDPSGVTSTITVAETMTVSDVNVKLNITHTYDDDLEIFLLGPDGTSVELSTDNGDSNNDFVDTVFDDEAPLPITAGEAPFTGSFQPESPLSVLDGLSAAGTWQLLIVDDAGSDLGTLDNWQLQLTLSESCDDSGIFADGFENGSYDQWSVVVP